MPPFRETGDRAEALSENSGSPPYPTLTLQNTLGQSATFHHLSTCAQADQYLTWQPARSRNTVQRKEKQLQAGLLHLPSRSFLKQQFLPALVSPSVRCIHFLTELIHTGQCLVHKCSVYISSYCYSPDRYLKRAR